ncbi:phosphatase PAP2 family protein [Xylophilus sp. GW821-FHT01B05]
MRLSALAAALAAACLASACAPLPTTSAQEVGDIWPGYVKGYLPPGALPDSLALLPAPPAPGSAAWAADVASFHTLAALRNTPRGALAVRDADLHFPAAAQTFSCALGVPVSDTATPHLNMLLRRTLGDAALSTDRAKEHYKRPRPFAVLNTPSCTPKEEAELAKNGSYPSGHSSIGWTWALVLAEVAPERADALLQRGRAFSQSRGICGVHWQSDIEAGRLIGAATVARLQSNPVFATQLGAARQEVATARAQGAKPAGDCAAEAAAIGSSARLAP